MLQSLITYYIDPVRAITKRGVIDHSITQPFFNDIEIIVRVATFDPSRKTRIMCGECKSLL
jgi:hypothetical protein